MSAINKNQKFQTVAPIFHLFTFYQMLIYEDAHINLKFDFGKGETLNIIYYLII